MDEQEVAEFVATYLKKKALGKQRALCKLKFSATRTAPTAIPSTSSTTKFFRSFPGSEDGPAQFQDEYSKLWSWTYSALDLYKHELLHVLYPLFIHCFMDQVAKKHIQECPQPEPFSIPFERTMKCCTYEAFRGWKGFFLPLIWRRWSLPIR